MIVIDTHVLLWWLGNDSSKLPARVLKTVEDELETGGVVASSISAWEIAMLVSKGKVDLSMDVMDWLNVADAIEGFRFIPVDNAVAVVEPDSYHFSI